MEFIPISYYLFFCTALFCIGVTGVLIKRNALMILMSVELMINSINLLLAAFSTYLNDPAGQTLRIFYHGRCSSRSGDRTGYYCCHLPYNTLNRH